MKTKYITSEAAHLFPFLSPDMRDCYAFDVRHAAVDLKLQHDGRYCHLLVNNCGVTIVEPRVDGLLAATGTAVRQLRCGRATPVICDHHGY